MSFTAQSSDILASKAPTSGVHDLTGYAKSPLAPAEHLAPPLHCTDPLETQIA